MDQRISLITLGCRDIAASAAFYEALGWRRVETPDGIIVLVRTGYGQFWPDREKYLGTAEKGPGAVAKQLRESSLGNGFLVTRHRQSAHGDVKRSAGRAPVVTRIVQYAVANTV